MNINTQISDSVILHELGARIARYRLNRNMTQAALAKEAGIAPITLHRLEQGEATQLLNFIRVLRVLKRLEALDMLLPELVVSPMEQLKLEGKTRQRARASKAQSQLQSQPKPKTKWVWDDNTNS